MRALNAGAREMSPLGARRAERGRPALRRQGRRAGRTSRTDGAWRSPIAKFFSATSRSRAVNARARGPDGRPAAVRRRPRGTSRRSRSARCGSSWPSASTWSREDRHDAGVGRRLPDVRVRRGGRSAGTAMHHPFTAPSGVVRRSRRRCSSRGYDLVLDGSRSAAARSVSTTPRCSSRCSRSLGMSRGGGPGALRLPARRAAVRRAAARRHRVRHRPHRRDAWPARESIRDVIAFPKTASGAGPADRRARRRSTPTSCASWRCARSSNRRTKHSSHRATRRYVERGPGLQARTDRARRGARLRRRALHGPAPKSDSGGSSPPSATAPARPGLQSAIDKANNAVGISKASATAHEQAAAAASGDSAAPRPGRQAGATATASPPRPSRAAARQARAQAGRRRQVRPDPRDLDPGKVVVALFYNAHGSDDNAALRAVRAADRHHGKVVVHSIPIDSVGDYDALTTGVQVLQAPTILVIAPQQQGPHDHRLHRGQGGRPDGQRPRRQGLRAQGRKHLTRLHGEGRGRLRRRRVQPHGVRVPDERDEPSRAPCTASRTASATAASQIAQIPAKGAKDAAAKKALLSAYGGFANTIDGAATQDQLRRAGRSDDRGELLHAGDTIEQHYAPAPEGRRRSPLPGLVLDSGVVPDERFSEHLNHPVGRGHAVAGGHAGSAGGSICGDIVRIDVRVEGETSSTRASRPRAAAR